MKTKINVMESIYDRNKILAAELNKELSKKNIFCINVLGAPGVGKTMSLMQIITKLQIPAYVLEGDISSDIDTQKLLSLGIKTVQINTNACHLDVHDTVKAVQKIEFSNGFLFIENIGNLVCPAEFMIGEHIKLLITAITDGSDKPYKYPLAFEKADIILLNKIDLKAFTDFDFDFFINGIRRLNPGVPVFQVSGKTGEGFDAAVKWLENKASKLRATIKQQY